LKLKSICDFFLVSSNSKTQAKMSAAVETAATPNEGAAAPAETTNAAQSPEVIASAAEGKSLTCCGATKKSNRVAGRRLYIGNLAYATTEGELKTFFKEFLV
jgi:RNA recognition motif-containing protein